MEFECQKDTEVAERFELGFENSRRDEIETIQIRSESKLEALRVSEQTPDPKTANGNAAISGHKGIPNSNGLTNCCGDVLLNFRRSIVDIPAALLSEIFDCLGPKELGIVSCVSTNFHRLASEHHVWKEFYSERWGIPSIPDEKSWKEMFVEREFRSRTFLGRYSIDVLYGHTEAVRAVSILVSSKLVVTSGYDSIVRMWDMEDGLAIASSRPLGCTIRAVAVDTKLLLAGGTDGFIHCWKAFDGLPHMFDIKAPQSDGGQFRLWEHEGPITSLALDLNRIYSGSWDMTVRIWDRVSYKCINILRHCDWVWGLVPRDTTIASTSGSDVYIWDIGSGDLMTVVQNTHVGNTYSIARSHSGDFLFTGGDDGAIHMFEIVTNPAETNATKIATWIPHTGPVFCLAFEFPWLVSASGDGKLSLIDVRTLLKSRKHVSKCSVEPPQRMLHGFGSNLFSVCVGADRIVCGGEEGVVRIWNFTQALEMERRVRAMRGIRSENRMRRRRVQMEINEKRNDQCAVAAKKNSSEGMCSKRRVSNKLKA